MLMLSIRISTNKYIVNLDSKLCLIQPVRFFGQVLLYNNVAKLQIRLLTKAILYPFIICNFAVPQALYFYKIYLRYKLELIDGEF